MRNKQFLSQEALFGLLLTQVATVLLHCLRSPIWLMALAAMVLLWRIQIYRHRWAFPNRIIRAAFVLLSLLAMVNTYREWYSLEFMMALLIVAFLLKLLELKYQRDAVVLVFVGYFVSTCSFLFDQGIIATVAVILVIFLLTACLLVLYGARIKYVSGRTLRLVSVLLLQAVPLMLLMLFVFPRIGALWSVPLQGSGGVTGVADSMSPGDFSQLTRSSKLAFRVSFNNNQVPDSGERYWRGLVFTQFDGRRWQREQNNNYFHKPSLLKPISSNDSPQLSYEIVLEPTNNAWLYGIPFARIIDKRHQRSVTNELWLSEPVTQRIKYRVASFAYPHVQASTQESRERLQQALLLPRGFNPRTLKLAQEWRAQTASAEAYIQKVLQYYRESFTYTLSPQLLGSHTIDEFLFSTQSGFCEHFSSSFVVLMRAAGIPARVVVGYQGGEWNAEDRYLLVRQYDAHAWAEVWLPKQGWVRIDPTAAVSPNRIDQGLLHSLSEEEQSLIGHSLLPSFEWLNRLGLQWDGLNYRWQRWVLSYDEDVQSQWLQDLLGQVTATRLAIVLVVPGVVFLFILSLFTLSNKSKPNAKRVKLYHYLIKVLQRKGIEPILGETPTQYCQRAMLVLPEKQALIESLLEAINTSLYVTQKDLNARVYRRLKSYIQQL